MARFVPAMLNMEVFPAVPSMKEKLETLLGHSSEWVPQEVLDIVPGWVLMVGTGVVAEEESGSQFAATSCSLGAT